MLRLLCCYYLHFIHHSELLRASLDFSSLQRVNASYVHAAERQRTSDVVWRLRLQGSGDWVYLYLLLEFQSTVDRYMALRMSVYTGLLYQDFREL